MKCTQFYPVLMTDRVAELSAFYQAHFRFRPAFEADWYVHLQSTEDESVNIAILDGTHETVPETRRGASSGLLLNFEVEDVDAVYAAFSETDVNILRPLRNEPFGQRHFIAEDPVGTMLDVITPIPPSPEFLAQYADGHAPGCA